jgi:hypothetical protein
VHAAGSSAALAPAINVVPRQRSLFGGQWLATIGDQLTVWTGTNRLDDSAPYR